MQGGLRASSPIIKVVSFFLDRNSGADVRFPSFFHIPVVVDIRMRVASPPFALIYDANVLPSLPSKHGNDRSRMRMNRVLFFFPGGLDSKGSSWLAAVSFFLPPFPLLRSEDVGLAGDRIFLFSFWSFSIRYGRHLYFVFASAFPPSLVMKANEIG